MSKNETPLIRRYWERIGGTLTEEFPAVKRTKNNGPRYVDAVIIVGGEKRVAHHSQVSLQGRDIVCLQAKNGRLGMYLMGQTFFSEQLLRRFEPKSITSVALCTRDDAVLRAMLEQYPNMKVVIIGSADSGTLSDSSQI